MRLDANCAALVLLACVGPTLIVAGLVVAFVTGERVCPPGFRFSMGGKYLPSRAFCFNGTVTCSDECFVYSSPQGITTPAAKALVTSGCLWIALVACVAVWNVWFNFRGAAARRRRDAGDAGAVGDDEVVLT